MDAFFAQIEQKENPALRGKPVLVAGSPSTHSVVTAASYEARPFGIKSGMALFQAKKLCPHAVVVRGDQDKYLRYSKKFIEACRQFSDMVEYSSVDEAYLDVTHCTQLFGPPDEIAKKLKSEVKKRTGLTCTVGIGPNKLLAKMAAKRNKPDGIGALTKDDVKNILWRLPAHEIPGVGTKYTKHLENLGITTIGRLANFPVTVLKEKFGVYGELLHHLANGQDTASVNPNANEIIKSMGHSLTNASDLETPEEIADMLLYLSDKVAQRLRAKKLCGQTITLTLRTPDYFTVTRAKTLHAPTISPQVIASEAFSLYKKYFDGQKARLLGVSVSHLFPLNPSQLSLFDRTLKMQKLLFTVDSIRKKYGSESIAFAPVLHLFGRKKPPQKVGVFLTGEQKTLHQESYS